MNFLNLKYFLTVAKCRSISEAARQLNVSQQSLSNHIAKLENELGVKLFRRAPDFELSYAGEQLEMLAGQICSGEEEIYRRMRDIAKHRRSKLRIGVTYTCGHAVLPKILPEFCRQHPLVEIELMEGNTRALEKWLESGEIDVMISFSPVNVSGAETFALCPERLIMAVPGSVMENTFGDMLEQYRSRLLQEMDISLFGDAPFILLKEGNRVRGLLDGHMRRRGFEPKILLETENTETALALTVEGMGISVFSELFIRQIYDYSLAAQEGAVYLFPFSSEDTLSELVISRMPRRYHSAAAVDFLELCIARLSDDPFML